jgi:hypothetical protein
MPQIVQEPISEAFAHVCTWYETGNIEKFDRDRSSSFGTAAVVGLAAVGKIEARAGTFNLKVTDGALRINGREPSNVALGAAGARRRNSGVCAAQSRSIGWGGMTYGKLPTYDQPT